MTATTTPHSSSHASPRVLIVDDDVIITRRIGELFELSGYGAERAHSAAECLSRLESDDAFDAVILDIGLGEREPHGGEVAATIRDRHGVPVVFYTGHTDRETIRLTRDTDSFGLVVKAPDDEEILLASVEAAIRRARIERETAERFDSYREILHWMPTPVCVFERTNGAPLFTNEAASRLFGERSRDDYDLLFDEDACPVTAAGRAEAGASPDEGWTIAGPFTDGVEGRQWLVATRDLGEDRTIRAHYDVTQLCEQARQLEREAQNAHALLRDVHHRVKNNLAVVDALLGMTQRRLAEPDTLDTVRTQVRAVQVLHERLHASQRRLNVDIAEYLEEISRSSLRVDSPARLETDIRVRERELPGEIALPLGLVVSELVTNAQKHSFVGDGDHWIRVTLREIDTPHGTETGLRELTVEYDGVPLPPDDVLDGSGGSGIALVRGLVRQIDAELAIGREPHNAFRIRFRSR